MEFNLNILLKPSLQMLLSMKI